MRDRIKMVAYGVLGWAEILAWAYLIGWLAS